MSNRRFQDRLRTLERMIRATAADVADDVDAAQLLRWIVDDPEAGRLYDALLTSVSITSCPHQQFGSCVQCYTHHQDSQEVHAAHLALQDRLAELSRSHFNQGEAS